MVLEFALELCALCQTAVFLFCAQAQWLPGHILGLGELAKIITIAFSIFSLVQFTGLGCSFGLGSIYSRSARDHG